MTLKVDPAALRSFAVALTGVAADVRGTKTDAPALVLPGTGLGAVAADAGTAVATSLQRIAQRIDTLATIAKGTAGNYEVTDTDFAIRMKTQAAEL
ncbi:type VII secretion target [Antrihabitans cavernicola]|uniref:ESX-1 secretion-associated protein n=1 Tax=Antrihabitans cavernicola TaxID=2495913 RepID=A0A5A7S4Q3_9NOCA|nr:type VII secretion target [Spelaeibacter cavernicola]KAA0021160.1 ESX-1 secretion-associated protein [Spelaeibacter cavernicola]